MSSNSLGKYLHIKKLCSKNNHLQMLAVDQRPPIFNIIKKAKKGIFTYKDVVECKNLISSNLSEFTTATLMDPYYSVPNLLHKNQSKGLIITLEDHQFKEKEKGRFSHNIKNWSVEKIKKMGGDAVKVLAWYRPDSNKESIIHQKKYIEKIGQECERFSIPFLLELLVYPFKNDQNYSNEYKEQQQKSTKHIIDSVREFSKKKYRVDIFKLESPVDSQDLNTKSSSQTTKKAFKDLAKATNNIPWVMLSSGMNKKSFINCLSLAYNNGASGYLAGRTIWLDAFNDYPNLNKIKKNLIEESSKYIKKLNQLTDKKARPLTKYLDNNLKMSNPIKFTTNYKGF